MTGGDRDGAPGDFRLTRRQLCALPGSAALLGLLGGCAFAARADAPPLPSDLFGGTTADPYLLALRAYIWGYPLVRAAQVRQNTTLPADPFRPRPPSAAGAAINRLGHAAELATPLMKQGVAPNNDTLYSLAWLDMREGPFVLEMPDFGDRYYTVQFGQADSSTEQALGQRTHGGQLPPVLIQGPDQQVALPAGMVGVRSRQRYMMIAERSLVRTPADLPAVHALQRAMRLRRWVDYAAGTDLPAPVSDQRPLLAPDTRCPAPLHFLEMLGNVLRDWRPDAGEARLISGLRPLGLAAGRGFRLEALSQAGRAAAARGLADAEAAVRAKTFTLGRNVNGWSVNYGGSVFGEDHLLRAAVAMDQIYVLPAEEALYPNARSDGGGQPLDGRNRYVLRFGAGDLPPVDAFWSITMYFARGLMVPNAAGIYSIGDRTGGLVRNADGGIDIMIQQEPPAAPRSVNWLPAPPEPFMVMMRLYRPRAPVRSGHWKPPAIQKIGGA
ncbi:DUF1254 domain-containing protein [Rhizorhabdus dicambivorans]|nr:DUF1214 domain-containing protein [Rhizorhabdus dicambivorans]